jgi:formate hydrogenlyase subunit 4
MIEMLIVEIFRIGLILILPPFLVGLIRKVKAQLQCRRGPSVFQPYYDLIKLLQKEVVVSTHASWIFRAAPYLVFASAFVAALLVPNVVSQVPYNFAGDIIAVVYLLALGTFFLMLAGLDAGSSFGGMGSSREAMVASLTEPAMIMAIFAVGLTVGSTNLSTIVHKTALLQGVVTDPPPHLMALAALFIVALAETGRIPVDNPATHLELTMIHEGMILEYSGRYLALMEWGSAIKLSVFLTLIANIFTPWGIATDMTPIPLLLATVIFLVKISGLCVLIAVIESMFAKLRLFRLPELLGVAFILSLLGLIFFYILRGGAAP